MDRHLAGDGIPWDAGIDPATVPAGSVAGLGLVTWVVLASGLFLGWRTVVVESGAAPVGDPAAAGVGGARPADDVDDVVEEGTSPSRRSVGVPK